MRLLFVCLSPTFGMHQYTADLANRMAAAGVQVEVLVPAHYPADRYAPNVHITPSLTNRSTGFSLEGLRIDQYWELRYDILERAPDLVHFTSPHVWTPWLLHALARAGIPTVHTLHDLDPHLGRRFGGLIRTWNTIVIRRAAHVLVHGRAYHTRLIAAGLLPSRLTYIPLLHLCFSYQTQTALEETLERWNVGTLERSRLSPLASPPLTPHPPPLTPYPLPLTPYPPPFSLFLGRLEPYKGLDVLIAAAAHLPAHCGRVVIAGPGHLEPARNGPLPVQIELRNYQIEDKEALELLSACSLVVLPYLDATQSAIIAVAYYFGKPVIVTRTGALPEYVEDGVTGWVLPPGDPQPLVHCLSAALSEPHRLETMGLAGRAWYQRERRTEGATLAQMYHSLAGHL